MRGLNWGSGYVIAGRFTERSGEGSEKRGHLVREERRIGSAEQLSCYLDGVERHLRLVAYHMKLARPEISERHVFLN